jgi:hypothetical protein
VRWRQAVARCREQARDHVCFNNDSTVVAEDWWRQTAQTALQETSIDHPHGESSGLSYQVLREMTIASSAKPGVRRMTNHDRSAAVRLRDNQHLVGRAAVVLRRAGTHVNEISNAGLSKASHGPRQNVLRRAVQRAHPTFLFAPQRPLNTFLSGWRFGAAGFQQSCGQPWQEIRQTEMNVVLFREEAA